MTIFMPAGSEVSFVNGAKPLVALQVFAQPESAQNIPSAKRGPDPRNSR